MIKDYYEILELTPLASPSDICKAYKSLALKWHPERAKGDKTIAYKQFSDVSEAFEVLSSQERRALYDRLGYLQFKNGHQTGTNQSIPGFQFLGNSEEIFESFFGTNNYYAALVQCDGEYTKYLSEKQRVQRQGPKSIELTVQLTILDLFRGKTLELAYDRETINGDGITTSIRACKRKVEVPVGYDLTRPITFKGEGNQTPGMPDGELIS